MAPGCCIRVLNGGGGELSHLGSLSLVSIRGCWLSFVSSGVVCVHFRVFIYHCKYPADSRSLLY